MAEAQAKLQALSEEFTKLQSGLSSHRDGILSFTIRPNR